MTRSPNVSGNISAMSNSRLKFCVAVCLLSGLMVTPTLAQAQSCTGTFTITDNGGAANYSLNSSADRLLINSGTFTGNINNFAAGATICVNPGATFAPSNISNPSGGITNLGTSSFNNLALNTGFSFSNLAGLTTFASNPNFNGQTTFYNAPNAEVRFISSLQFGGNSSLNNEGLMNFSADFQNNLGSTVVNNNRMQFSGGNFNPQGAFTNNGQVVGAGFINVNSGSTLINNCSLLANNGFNNNSGNTQNYGYILVKGISGFPADLWQNNQPFFQGPNGVVSGKRFSNNSAITSAAGGGGRYFFEKSAGYAENVHTINQGPFTGSAANPTVFYDTTQSAPPNIFDVQNTAPTNTIRQFFTPPTEFEILSSCSAVFAPTADVVVTKSAPSTVLQGSTITYQIVIVNNGPSAVTGLSLTDTVPGSIGSVAWSCSATGAADCNTATAGTGASGTGNNISLSNLQLNAGAGNQINLTVTGTALVSGTVTNQVSIALPSGVTDPDPNNNTSTASTSVTPTVNLQISKTNGQTVLAAGSVTNYTITVSNTGLSAANGATLRDIPSAGLVCTSITCNTAASTTACPAAGNGVGQLSISNVTNAGVLLDLPANSTLSFNVSCNVVATGQ